ncbi:MAG: hypothetical protein HY859_10040 [Caulobacterales bacterium]|nr:hypothetical protein [Caulobacterales bacterium]
MKPITGLVALALVTLAPAGAALAIDYRVAAETNTGLGLVDADAVEVVGSSRRIKLTVIFPQAHGEPAEVGVASVLVDCDRARYRMESMIGYDVNLKEKTRDAAGSEWVDAEEGTPFFPASDFACRGIALPRAESQDLKTIVDRFLRRAAGGRVD